jgi:hypothetical protein
MPYLDLFDVFYLRSGWGQEVRSLALKARKNDVDARNAPWLYEVD